MSYTVKEIYYTLQGEGMQAGRAAVFCRFTGCNLWSGREQDRSKAICQFCDTDFIGTDGPGGGKFRTAEDLAEAVVKAWKGNRDKAKPLVVFTGGEPLLQLDVDLITVLHHLQFEVAVETNGTKEVPTQVDHICVSPKAGAPLIQTTGHELKLVFPQAHALPEQFTQLQFDRFYLQPMDGPNVIANTQSAIQYCLDHPQWQLSIQTHKVIGIP